MRRCPGQDTRYWGPEDVVEVDCAECGRPVEFFKTDGSRRCPGCGARVINPKVSMGCAQWCKHAKECLGFEPPAVDEEASAQESLADRLIAAVKDRFGEDQRRVAHALRVLDHAEVLLREEDAAPRVVIAAALLHDIGIQEAERKHGSSAARYHELEGPAIAREIMAELDFEEETISHVCSIVGSHHSGGKVDTPEFRILWDADRIVNIEEGEVGGEDTEELDEVIERTFRTDAGRARARDMFLDAGDAD